MTEWKTTVHISASSQSSIAAQQKIVLADGSLCSRQQSGGGEGGMGGGGWGVPLCSPSELTQIVPISASIYTVFHSVIFNSVIGLISSEFKNLALDGSKLNICTLLARGGRAFLDLRSRAPAFPCSWHFRNAGMQILYRTAGTRNAKKQER